MEPMNALPMQWPMDKVESLSFINVRHFLVLGDNLGRLCIFSLYIPPDENFNYFF